MFVDVVALREGGEFEREIASTKPLYFAAAHQLRIRRTCLYSKAVRVAPALLSVLSLACTPAVHAFRVQPETYCRSTKFVHIMWDASGDTTVTLAPIPSGDTTVTLAPTGMQFHDDEGDKTVPATPMTVSIEAYRHHRKAGKPPRGVAPMPPSRPLVDEAGQNCDATSSKTRIIPVGPDEYDPKSYVASITNECASNDPADPCPIITICHGPDEKNVCARQWQVAPGTPVPLTGVTMTGAWQLSRPLQTGESCGPAAGSGDRQPATPGPPPSRHMTHLKVRLGLECT